MRHSSLPTFLVLLLLTACADTTSKNPNVDTQAFNRDKAECLDKAGDESPPTMSNINNVAGSKSVVTSAINGYRIAPVDSGVTSGRDMNKLNRLQLARACMTSKGWAVPDANDIILK